MYPRSPPALSFTSPSPLLPAHLLPQILKDASQLAHSQLPEVVIFNVASLVEDRLSEVEVKKEKGVEGMGKGEAIKESLAEVVRRREEEKALVRLSHSNYPSALHKIHRL